MALNPRSGCLVCLDDRMEEDRDKDEDGLLNRSGVVSAWRGTRHVVLLFVLVFACGYGGSALPVLSKRLPEHFGLTEAGLGLVMSCGLVGSLLSLVVAGPLSDRWGARRMLRAALGGVGVGFLICAVGVKLPVFVAGLMIATFSVSAIGVAMPAYLIHLYPDFKRRSLSLSFMVTTMTGMVFPFIVDRLMSAAGGRFALVLHLPFGVVGVFILAGRFVFAGAPCDVSEGAEGRCGGVLSRSALFLADLAGNVRSMCTPSLLLILFLLSLHGFCDTAFYVWLPRYMEIRFGDTPIRAGDVLAMYSGAYLVARLTLAALPERLGRRAFLVFPGLLGGSLLFLCVLSDRALFLCVGYPLAALLWSVEYPALLSLAVQMVPRSFSTFLAASTLASTLGSMVLISVIGGFIHASRSATFLITGLMGLRVPWYLDMRLALLGLPVGFILFGVLAAVSGLGRARRAR